MKKITSFLFFIIATSSAVAQFSMYTTIGITGTNRQVGRNLLTRLNTNLSVTAGVDFELSIRGKELKPVYPSLSAGAYYLKNGYDVSYKSSVAGEDLHESSKLTTTYFQVPLVARINIQPLPLVENWWLHVGGGISANLLLSGTLQETGYGFGNGVELFKDKGDVKPYAKSLYQFGVVELGTTFNRLRITYRFKISLQNMYFNNLDSDWAVPYESSIYLRQANEPGELRELHQEFLVSYKFFGK